MEQADNTIGNKQNSGRPVAQNSHNDRDSKLEAKKSQY